MPNQPLANKTALITGGARRIGRAIALALAEAGADVAIVCRNSRDAADQTAREIEQTGRRTLVVPCDIRSESSVHAAVAAVTAHYGRLDILVNNAAVFHATPIEEVTLAEWDEVFETNARGPFLVSREALQALRATQGRIVNIGSLGGMHAWATHAHYCASKAALHMLTQCMAKAFAPEVSVNCVAPGWIDMEGKETGRAAHFAAKTPMRRNGRPEEIAAAVLFFVTAPQFITGQILAVDGGLGL